jgi:carbon-monoxide dehydrogenase catalytic subunit
MAEEKPSRKKMRTPEERSLDPAAREMLIRADELGLATAFSRADAMAPCPIGSTGSCCHVCFMGPCRLVKDGQTGVCGATIETITARNFARAIAAGASAHSDHGRDLALTLLAVAKGEAQGYQIRDPFKLAKLAKELGIASEGRPLEEVVLDVGQACLNMFGQQTGEVPLIERAPAKRKELWRKLKPYRAASTAKSTCCTGPIWATIKTRSTSSTRGCAPPLATAGALNGRHRPVGHPLRHAQPSSRK